jgi:hypothetical protein
VRFPLRDKLNRARQELKKAGSPDYVDGLRGGLGADPFGVKTPEPPRSAVAAR